MWCRRPLILTSVVAVAAVSLLAAACGGGGSPAVARIGSSTTASSTTAARTTVRYGAHGEAYAGGLAFARCMRSHGIPNWPDPLSDGGFDKSKLRQLGLSVSRVQSIEERSCRYVFQNGSQGQTITPADQIDYLKAAACMRRHGFRDFPDPTFQDNNVNVDVPSSIDTNSSKFKRAAATCTKLIPAGLPYSRSSGS